MKFIGVLSNLPMTLYHTILNFKDPGGKRLLKTFWEREKKIWSQALSLLPKMFSNSNLFNSLLHRYSFLTHQQQIAFENIMGKEEIALNEQFLLFPQCFLLNQKIVFPLVNIFDIISLFDAELEEPEIGI